MNYIDGQLTTYTYAELTYLRRELQKENARLKVQVAKREKYAELAKQAIAELEKYDCKGIITDECKPEDGFTLACDNYWFCRLRAELLVES